MRRLIFTIFVLSNISYSFESRALYLSLKNIGAPLTMAHIQDSKNYAGFKDHGHREIMDLATNELERMPKSLLCFVLTKDFTLLKVMADQDHKALIARKAGSTPKILLPSYIQDHIKNIADVFIIDNPDKAQGTNYFMEAATATVELHADDGFTLTIKQEAHVHAQTLATNGTEAATNVTDIASLWGKDGAFHKSTPAGNLWARNLTGGADVKLWINIHTAEIEDGALVMTGRLLKSPVPAPFKQNSPQTLQNVVIFVDSKWNKEFMY